MHTHKPHAQIRFALFYFSCLFLTMPIFLIFKHQVCSERLDVMASSDGSYLALDAFYRPMPLPRTSPRAMEFLVLTLTNVSTIFGLDKVSSDEVINASQANTPPHLKLSIDAIHGSVPYLHELLTEQRVYCVFGGTLRILASFERTWYRTTPLHCRLNETVWQMLQSGALANRVLVEFIDAKGKVFETMGPFKSPCMADTRMQTFAMCTSPQVQQEYLPAGKTQPRNSYSSRSKLSNLWGWIATYASVGVTQVRCISINLIKFGNLCAFILQFGV